MSLTKAIRISFLLLLTLSVDLSAQPKEQPHAAKIKLALKKLNFLGTVLYVAAHPDDENTRAIAYLANEKLATTGYLSMTRGDGGQNLIGPEIRDQLGVIRTQELLAARRIDGGVQFFTRANDFGYSKSAEEALRIWNKDEILSDVVRVIRQFQPDVILTRFPADERAGHGHHTASAMLAQEAFDISGNPDAYPDQVKEFGVWQVQSIYTNTGRWWNQDITKDSPGIVTMDVGAYNPLLGKSYSEIAAVSRTQHKSQGFGSSGSRGEALEFFEFEKGFHAKHDILENVNTTWSRVEGGKKVEALVGQLIENYSEENPAASIPILLQVRKEISNLKDGIWKKRKLIEVDQLIKDCLGLYVSVKAANFYGVPGGAMKVSYEVVNRSTYPIAIKKIGSSQAKYDSVLNIELKYNQPLEIATSIAIPNNISTTGPYWLRNPHSLGLFNVPDKSMIGKPDSEPAIEFEFLFDIGGQQIESVAPLIYTWTDAVKGELVRPFEIVPSVTLNLSESVIIFNDAKEKNVAVRIKSFADREVNPEVRLELPKGWRSEPANHLVKLSKRDEEILVNFKVYPGQEEITSVIKAVAKVDGQMFSKSLQTIEYDHIPTQTILNSAEASLVRINLKTAGKLIGYVQGAGDEIPAALRNMGYEVWEMKNEEVTPENLKRLDAVVLGIRVLHTNDRIYYLMDALLSYVENGGTMIMQYNTTNRWGESFERFSPYPIHLSRERVSDETSKVTFLAPNHQALNTPNKITSRDFDNWVQERGLYFPDQWDSNYEALLSMSDPGEDLQNGALLIARYGKGYYVYTGLSFFRELPEGVPGAYKLFANLVSLGNGPSSSDEKTKSGK